MPARGPRLCRGRAGRGRAPSLLTIALTFLLSLPQVGPDSAEIMQGMGVAVKMGVTKKQLDTTIGIHPSGEPSSPVWYRTL